MKKIMANNVGAFVGAISTAAVAGAVAFYGFVKNQASQHLLKQGAFNEAITKRNDSLIAIGKPVIAPDPENPQVKEINQRFLHEQKASIHKNHADTLSGAWSILSPEEKRNVACFSTIASIAVGAFTYFAVRSNGKPGKRTHSGDGVDDAGMMWFWAGGGFDGGHHGGGFGF